MQPPILLWIQKNLDSKKPLHEQGLALRNAVRDELGSTKLAGVFCAAGGWAGGSIGDDDCLDTIMKMSSVNLMSAAFSAHVAIKYLDNHGVLALTGSEPALRPTPSMIGYGISKSSTHYLIKSIAEDPAFKAKEAVALGFLPVTLDTPMNRKYMPDADFTSWTKVSYRLLMVLMSSATIHC